MFWVFTEEIKFISVFVYISQSLYQITNSYTQTLIHLWERSRCTQCLISAFLLQTISLEVDRNEASMTADWLLLHGWFFFFFFGLDCSFCTIVTASCFFSYWNWSDAQDQNRVSISTNWWLGYWQKNEGTRSCNTWKKFGIGFGKLDFFFFFFILRCLHIKRRVDLSVWSDLFIMLKWWLYCTIYQASNFCLKEWNWTNKAEVLFKFFFFLSEMLQLNNF